MDWTCTGYANTLNNSGPAQNFIKVFIENTTTVQVDCFCTDQ